jgi:hypothetical protein
MEVSGHRHAPAALSPGKYHPPYPLDSSLGGSQRDLDAVLKRKYPCQESNPVHPSCSLVTVLTELSRLLKHGRDVYESLVGKPEGKRPLGSPRCGWGENIMDLCELVCECVNWIHVAQDMHQRGSCEYGNGPLGSVKGGKYLY